MDRQVALQAGDPRSRSATLPCLHPATGWRSVSSCLVGALLFPDSSISSDPCCSTTDGSPEVGTRDRGRPGVLERRRRGGRHIRLRRLELGVGVV